MEQSIFWFWSEKMPLVVPFFKFQIPYHQILCCTYRKMYSTYPQSIVIQDLVLISLLES